MNSTYHIMAQIDPPPSPSPSPFYVLVSNVPSPTKCYAKMLAKLFLATRFPAPIYSISLVQIRTEPIQPNGAQHIDFLSPQARP